MSIKWLALCLNFYTALAAAQTAPVNPLPIGTPGTTAITFGDAYASAVELYDVKITVLEVVRGEKAWDVIHKANADNKPPATGSDYILARVKFEFASKDTPGNRSYIVREDQFGAVSATGTEYDNPSVSQLKPALNGSVYAGDSLEGWIAFSVPKGDKPLMTFKGTFSHGSGVWFQLF